MADFDLRDFIRQTVREEIQTMLTEDGPEDKGSKTDKKGKKGTKKEAVPGTYKVGQKGRVPAWLKTKAGVKDSTELQAKYKKGTVFTEGKDLPPKNLTSAPAA
jgi:hypothetical protein